MQRAQLTFRGQDQRDFTPNPGVKGGAAEAGLEMIKKKGVKGGGEWVGLSYNSATVRFGRFYSPTRNRYRFIELGVMLYTNV